LHFEFCTTDFLTCSAWSHAFATRYVHIVQHILSGRHLYCRRESHCGGRTRAATPSSTAGRSGRAGCRKERSTSLTPTGFSRGQAIRVGLTSIGIRHGNTSDILTAVLGCCGHTAWRTRATKPNSPRSRRSTAAIPPRVFRHRVLVASSQRKRFEPRSGCRHALAARRAGIVSVRDGGRFPGMWSRGRDAVYPQPPHCRLRERRPPANNKKIVESAMSQALAADAARARTPSLAMR